MGQFRKEDLMVDLMEGFEKSSRTASICSCLLKQRLKPLAVMLSLADSFLTKPVLALVVCVGNVFKVCSFTELFPIHK